MLSDEYVKVVLDDRARERERARLVSEAKRCAQNRRPAGRRWRWRVEPGMEEAFRDLLDWFLPSQRDAEIHRDDSR
jgi:hypothetical protein